PVKFPRREQAGQFLVNGNYFKRCYYLHQEAIATKVSLYGRQHAPLKPTLCFPSCSRCPIPGPLCRLDLIRRHTVVEEEIDIGWSLGPGRLGLGRALSTRNLFEVAL